MKFFLALSIITIIPSYAFAVDKEDVHLALDFERMKLRSDYSGDLNKPMKEGQLFILWVSYEDPKLYKWLKKNRSDAIHCFIDAKQLQGVQPGIVVGIRRKDLVEQAKALNVSKLDSLKTEEVIPYSLGLPPGSLADPSLPLSRLGTPEELPWIGFRH